MIMYDILSYKLHLTYPLICVCCASKIKKNDIICNVCLKYMNLKIVRKIENLQIMSCIKSKI